MASRVSETPTLDRVLDRVYEQLKAVGGDPLCLPDALQPVALLGTVQAIIDNGGFRYLFENDFPFQTPYSIFSDAYRRIGADEAADLLDQTVARFPMPHPERNAEKRQAFMDSLDDEDAFFTASDAIYDQGVWAKLEAYVVKHAQAFPL